MTAMKRIIAVFVIAALALATHATPIKGIRMLNRQAAEVTDQYGHTTTLDFYGPNVVRMFRDEGGGILRDPEATPPAEILVRNARKTARVTAEETTGTFVVRAEGGMAVSIDKGTGLFAFTDFRGDTLVVQTMEVSFAKGGYDMALGIKKGEYFFGGGVQNGRFSHRGGRISIVNTNSWTDGGVCSPAPFYWSTAGYGVLCHTFRPGYYDFTGSQAVIHHDADYLDIFLWTGQDPEALLDGYYQLTGHPVLLPKFAFYEGHLNAYNRDYWVPTDDEQRGILFEDGKRYTESQKPVEGGIRESLCGEGGGYQFSAQAVIDRYASADMPLGWVLPNDGYGAGYGQEETLDGNVENLKNFGGYARERGVEIGLWTQSNLHPVDSIPALLQRDIVKEVRDAGVRVLKTDVAWVGAGYSFGLNGIDEVAQILPFYGQQARPFIITLDGWAGTQRYAGIWTGDQTGGEWEYIRFHIPTYIAAGLSGMPNITSDTDGIFGGRNMAVNIRDFQWKTFTPMQLNMDGWGANPKYPQALGEPATSINRTYLKLKSMLLPYSYTYAHEAVTGKPLIRAMFLDAPNTFTLGRRTQYQFLYGPDFLVAPIYEEGEIRNGIYLPKGTWYDYFTGDAYEGGIVLNSYDVPLWKLPVFVREGAIIPMNNPNNNPSQIDPSLCIIEVYPSTTSTHISVYDDDGKTDNYLRGSYITREISQQTVGGRATICIQPAKVAVEGLFPDGVPTRQRLHLVINMPKPKSMKVRVNGKAIKTEWKYGKESIMEKIGLKRPAQLLIDLPETSIYDKVEVSVEQGKRKAMPKSEKAITLPSPETKEAEATAYTLTPAWQATGGAEYYEMEFEGMRYTNIRSTNFTFDLLEPETDYQFRLRAIGKEGVSEWTDIALRTTANPLEFAMRGMTATCSVPDQSGSGIEHLFDQDERGEIWHTSWEHPNANPFIIDIDLHAVTQLERLLYIPRDNAGNGTLLKGSISLSRDGRNWSSKQAFLWKQNNLAKEISILNEDAVRYIRIEVEKSVGGFGSGAELYAFRKPDSKVLIPGDINQDGKIDDNDLTSYLNYTGLRRGDSDFDGYVSVGDVNQNGLIDAQDISNVAIQLDGGAGRASGSIDGNIELKCEKKKVMTGEDIVVTVVGRGLKAVNALSLAIPYNQQELEFLGVEPLAVSEMTNMTNNRLHSNGNGALYPTFVNIGRQRQLQGDEVPLFRLRFKAKATVNTHFPFSGMLVDRELRVIEL